MPADNRQIVAVKAKVLTTNLEIFDITRTVRDFDLYGVMEHEEWFGGGQIPESTEWDSSTTPIITITYDDDTTEEYAEDFELQGN